MVPPLQGNAQRRAYHTLSRKKTNYVTFQGTTSHLEGPYPGCWSFVRTAFVNRGFPEEAIHGIISSVSEATMKQYDGWFRRWWQFTTRGKNAWNYNLREVIQFLDMQFHSRQSYSSINTCRAALSFFLSTKEGDEAIIKRYLKGIYNRNPPTPKYDTTWDPQPVLLQLEKMYPLDKLTLEQLSHKLVTLLALITAHRVQTFTKIRLRNIVKLEDRIEIFIPEKMKTRNRNRYQPILKLPYFLKNPGLCLASTLLHYINETKDFRTLQDDTLIITHKKPYHSATNQTISRWIKQTLKASGIDTETYKSHSTRHAATSAAYRAGVNIEEIRKRAGWSEKSNTFNIFYNKPMVLQANTFAKGVVGAHISMG